MWGEDLALMPPLQPPPVVYWGQTELFYFIFFFLLGTNFILFNFLVGFASKISKPIGVLKPSHAAPSTGGQFPVFFIDDAIVI